MPLLTSEEAFDVSDSFLMSLYGSDLFTRWKALKEEMQFIKEREYVNWLIEVANQYKKENDANNLNTVSADTAQQDYTQDGIKEEGELTGYFSQYQSPFQQDIMYNRSTRPLATDSESYGIKETSVSSMQNTSGNQQQLHNAGEEDKTDLLIPDTEATISQQIDEFKEEDYNSDSAKEQLNVEEAREIILSSGEEDDVDEIMDQAHGLEYGISGQELAAATDSGIIGEDMLRGGKRCCPYCSYSTNNSTDVKKHVIAVHQKLKPFSCEFCNYHCAQKSVLNSHLIRKHGFQSKYRCFCGKFFARLRELQRHRSSCTTTENT